MNIFEMYYNNDKKVGFWVMRNSWKNVVARVVSIGGIKSGPLTGLGRFPYFNEAKESVDIEMYKITETDSMVTFTQIVPEFSISDKNKQLAILSCPGTSSYRQVKPAKFVSIVKLEELTN